MYSKRLSTLLSYISADDVVADIGSDHGFIPLALVKKGHPYVYASENKKGPYNRLCATFKAHNITNVEVGLNDGLTNLPARVNTILISGMGGTLIEKILKAHPSTLANVHKLILAPQGNEKVVRLCLNDLGFVISDENVVKDDKFYEIIIATRGQSTYSDFVATFGPLNLVKQGAAFKQKWKSEIKRLQKLLLNEALTTTKQNAVKSEITNIKRALKEE